MSVVLSEHLPLLASAPDGIQKLRGLIYELAARGQLAEADPAIPATPVKLGEIAEFVMGQAPPGNECNTDGVGTIFVKTGEFGESFPAIREWTTKPLKYAKQGDVLICVVGATVGKLNLGIDCAIGRSVAAIRPCENLETRYLYAALVPFTLRLRGQSRGSAQGVIGKAELGQIVIRFPSVSEQHRIVAKVDELMALCDRLEAEQTDATSAHAKLVEALLGTLTQSRDADELAANWQRLSQHFDTLFSTETSLDALKQTILQLAVMGKLVPQDAKDEPASELLKRIAKEKARLEAEGSCKKSKPMPPADGDTFYSLPNPWNWSTLDSLVHVMDSGWSPACIETPSPRNDVWGVLKTTAVQTFQYLEYENKELPGHLEPRPECEVAAGDILITRAGPKNRVAISCLVEATRPLLMISDKIIRFHLVEGGMCEKFVALCLNAGATAAYLESAKSGMAASQMNITQEKLRAAPIPICSTAEQHRIVAKVDELMALCDRLKADLAEARTRQARLSATLIDAALKAA